MAIFDYFITGAGMFSGGNSELDSEQTKIVEEFLSNIGQSLNGIARVSKEFQRNDFQILFANSMFVGYNKSKAVFVSYNKSGLDYYRIAQINIEHDVLNVFTQVISQSEGEVVYSFEVELARLFARDLQLVADTVNNYVQHIIKAKSAKKTISTGIPLDIQESVDRFKEDFPEGSKTAFIIMRFGTTPVHDQLVVTIKSVLKKHNISAIRADEVQYSDDLFTNIKTLMHSCDFGIAIFERIEGETFNPNVALEVGYMMASGKNLLLLKEKSLTLLPTDLIAKLYQTFDAFAVETTLPVQIEKWLKVKKYIS